MESAKLGGRTFRVFARILRDVLEVLDVIVFFGMPIMLFMVIGLVSGANVDKLLSDQSMILQFWWVWPLSFALLNITTARHHRYILTNTFMKVKTFVSDMVIPFIFLFIAALVGLAYSFIGANDPALVAPIAGIGDAYTLGIALSLQSLTAIVTHAFTSVSFAETFIGTSLFAAVVPALIVSSLKGGGRTTQTPTYTTAPTAPSPRPFVPIKPPTNMVAVPDETVPEGSQQLVPGTAWARYEKENPPYIC